MRLSIFISAVMLAGQGAMAEIELDGTIRGESELDRTLISKPSWLRGLHFAGQEMPTPEQPELRTVLPMQWSGKLICARVTSMSGDYSAMVEFEVPQMSQRERASLRFAPASPIPTQVTPENSGVSIEQGPCIGDNLNPTGGSFVANYWNELAEPVSMGPGLAQLVLNMNIARADELDARTYLGGSPAEGVLDTSCNKLTDPDALAFNYRCIVAVPTDAVDDPAGRELKFEYERIYRGRPSATRSAKILIGSGL